MIYECHITCKLEDAAKATEVAALDGWKTSEIHRDPTLGNNSYFYLTAHDRNVEHMFERMRRIEAACFHMKIEVLRSKIELIIHDTKLSKPVKSLSQSVEQAST